MSKYCSGCKADKDCKEFAKNNSKKDGLQIYCKACKKKYDAAYYQANKEKQLLRNNANRKKYRKKVAEYKLSHGCSCCDENNPCCLDFHHPNKDKDKDVANLLYSPIRLWKEIKKCVVVCANCHRKIHAGELKC